MPTVRYCLRYLCDGYIMADALRPTPGWGSKGYTVDAAQLGEHTDEDLIRCAKETAPPGYWLQHIEAIGGDPRVRDVFKKAAPWSRNEPRTTRAASLADGGIPHTSSQGD